MIRVWFPEYGELEEEGTDYPGGLREACEAACRAFDDHAGGFTEQGFKVKALDPSGKVWTVTVETELEREYHARPLFGGVLRECVDSWALETVAEIQRSDADAISLPVPPPGPPLRVEATLAENGDAWSWTLTPDQVERLGNAPRSGFDGGVVTTRRGATSCAWTHAVSTGGVSPSSSRGDDSPRPFRLDVLSIGCRLGWLGSLTEEQRARLESLSEADRIMILKGNAVGGFRVTADRLRAWSGQKKAGVVEDAGGHDDIEALRASASRTDPGDQETPPPRETSAHGGSLETVCETLNDDPR